MNPTIQSLSTSVQRMTFPLALYSERWNILMLVMDSMDLPSMGLEILRFMEENTSAVRIMRSTGHSAGYSVIGST